MSTRDSLRSSILGVTAPFRKEIVKEGDFEYEVRQTTRKERSDLFKKCQDDEGKMDAMALMLWGAIYCTFVPETNDKVFEEGDYETLLRQPTGGIVDKLGKAAMELLNVEDDVEKK